MKTYLLIITAIAIAAALAFEAYVFGVVFDILRVIMAG